MKLRLLSAVPNGWGDSAADLRGLLFTVIVMGGVFALKGVALDEGNAFLLSTLIAILMIYWIPPVPKESYVHWILTNSVLLFGVYLFLFKIPLFFSAILSYRSAQVICVSAYCICCWFLMRLKKKSSMSGI
jgi:hypothetical protein